VLVYFPLQLNSLNKQSENSRFLQFSQYIIECYFRVNARYYGWIYLVRINLGFRRKKDCCSLATHLQKMVDE
jgi:hypothetical protein